MTAIVVELTKPPPTASSMYAFYYPHQQEKQPQLYFPSPPRRHGRCTYTSSPLSKSHSSEPARESVKDLIARWSGISFIRRKLDDWMGEKKTKTKEQKPVKGLTPNPKLHAHQLDRVRLRTVEDLQLVPRKEQQPHEDPPTPEHVKEIAERIESQSQAAYIQYLLDLSSSANYEKQYFIQADPKNADKHFVQNVQRYDFYHTIGSGSFSKVKLARDLNDGKWVAIKLINTTKLRLNGRLQKVLVRELGILSKVKHPSIVKFEGLFVVKGYICLAMEYVKGGELFKAISELNGVGIKETEARDILRQLLSAILYLHTIGIVHRDLKLENILVCDDDNDDDDEIRIKLVDFGLGRTVKDGQQLQTRCGSEEYAAPEIIRGQVYDGKLTDAWSFGVIMYACLTGHLPFNPDDKGSLPSKILAGHYWIDETSVSQAAVGILRGLLTVDPSKRTSLQSLQNHHYFM